MQYYKDEYGYVYRTNARRRTYDIYSRDFHVWWNRYRSKNPFEIRSVGGILTEISYEDFMLEMI